MANRDRAGEPALRLISDLASSYAGPGTASLSQRLPVVPSLASAIRATATRCDTNDVWFRPPDQILTISPQMDCGYDLFMPDEYFTETIRPQLWSLLEEDVLKDTAITLRGTSISMNSFVLSLLSPVLRTMVCGNFQESGCREVRLDVVEAERLLKLLQLACGKEGLVAVGIEELRELGELAERLQMEAVRSEMEQVEKKEVDKIKTESASQHGKSRLLAHTGCRYDLVMPDEYFKDTIRPELWSLLDEDALKDTTITLRGTSISVSSFILSLLSPVLRKMVCGNFRESICKEIGLDDVEADRMLELMHMACGKKELVAKDFEELLELGELADRLQMEAVRSEIENNLLKELSVENCLDMFQRSEATGLDFWQKGCYKMMRDEFGVISQKDGFLKLSEQTFWALLEEDELRASREEDVFEAVVRWLSGSDDRMSGAGLLRKIRYGVLSDEYRMGLLFSASLPGNGMVKELVREAMAKRGGAVGEGMWDGVERLCDKWMVARGMKGRIIGADLLKKPVSVAMDGQGRIVVSDSELHEIIIFKHDGSVARRFGSKGTAAGQFNPPTGVAVDQQGRIVVADWNNHRIQMLNADGSVVRCLGSWGTAVGQLIFPWGLAIDREGHIVVSDSGNHQIQIIAADGSVVRHFGSFGAAVGQLDGPMGVAVDGAGRIVVADCCNDRVQVFNMDGSVALCFGSEGDGPGQLNGPEGVAVDSAGRFVVADTGNDRVQVFNPDGSVFRVVGSAGLGVGELRFPVDVVLDGAGRIIVAEYDNSRVQVL